MHKKLPKIYHFINNFDKNLINNLNLNIALIYRNYNEKFNINLLTDLKEFCKIKKRKFFLSNNIKLAVKLNLDGAYIPSFNNDLKHCNYKKKRILYYWGQPITLSKFAKKNVNLWMQFFLLPCLIKKKHILDLTNLKNYQNLQK